MTDQPEMSDPVKMNAVIVVNLPTVSREEYEWALDQIERAATGSLRDGGRRAAHERV